MDSASSGSFRKRYSSTLDRAESTPSGEIDFSLSSIGPPSFIWLALAWAHCISDLPHQTQQGIVKIINDPFLERNDGIVGNVDVLWADFGAALGDVADADATFI